MNNFKVAPLAAAIVALTSMSTVAVADTSLRLEEVFVTATKQPDSLQDIPIAISAMTGDKIQEQGISELEDLSAHMPNVHIAEAGTGTNLFIRGVGSGVNYGFEQSVGTFIDGVYYGRGRSARGGFLDIQMVEVLKGPQSILFGKNTVAGAINITTAAPSFEFEGYIEAAYETEVEGKSITAMVTGPLSDTLRGRLVAKTYEDDGFVENTFEGEDGPQEENQIFRGILEWDALDDLTLTFKAEHGTFDVTGRSDGVTISTPTSDFLYSTTDGDPNFSNPSLNYKKSTSQVVSPKHGNGEYDDTTTNNYSITAEYLVGDATIRSITAYTEYDFENYLDLDYSPLKLISAYRTEDYDQLSQEFLLSGSVNDSVEYLTGLYYQTNDQTSAEEVNLVPGQAPVLESIIFNGFGFCTPTCPPSGLLDVTGNNEFEQETTTWSAFGQVTFNVTDDLRIAVGARYSDEEKEMTKSSVVSTAFDTAPNPFLNAVYGPGGLAFLNTHTFDGNTPGFDNVREEEHWSGNINVQYNIDVDSMIYFNAANGFKAGGYDESNRLGIVDVEEFEDESVMSYEVGAKIDLWEGRARVNVAAFISKFEDLQVSTFDGNCCFVVGNAGESEVKGIEVDGEVLLSEGLIFRAAFAYLDSEYTKFDGAACYNGQTVAQGCVGGVQDLKGKPLQFSPEWSGNVSLAYDTSLTSALDMKLAVDVNYSDEQHIANDLDENLIQDSFVKVNAVARLADSDGVWSVSLVGKNLTEEETSTWGNDVPLGVLGFAGTYMQHIDPPRTYELQARYNF